MDDGGHMWSCRESRETSRRPSQRLMAAIILAGVLTACTSWQTQDLLTLPGAMLETQPTRMRVITQRTGTLVLQDPAILGDELIGIGSREGFMNTELVRIQFSELTEASFRALDVPRSALLGAGSLLIVFGLISGYSSSSSGP